MGKRINHLKVVLRHKKYVFHECRKCGIIFQGLKHDLSKFSLTEFGPSAQHFQGDRSPIKAEKEERGYSFAWQHHMGHNRHHWQYWIDYADDGSLITVKMPYKYVVEMACDWIGAGKAYNVAKWTESTPMDHYIGKSAERHLNRETDYLLFLFCSTIKNYGIDAFYELARNKAVKEFYEKGKIEKLELKPFWKVEEELANGL